MALMGIDRFVWRIRKPRMSFVDHESPREEKTPKLFSELAVKFWRERPDRRIGTLDPLVSILGKSTFHIWKVRFLRAYVKAYVIAYVKAYVIAIT